MRTVLFIFVFIFTFGFFFSGFSQSSEYSTTTKKAIRYYRLAGQSYQAFDYGTAERYAREAITSDRKFVEAYLLLGDILTEEKKISEAIHAYDSAIYVNPHYYFPVYYLLAKLELKSGLYEKASQHLKIYLTYPEISQGELSSVEKMLTTCDFALQAIKHPVAFDPVNLGDSINSKYDEYVNAITVDGEKLYLTVHKPVPVRGNSGMHIDSEDFYVSNRLNGILSKAKPLGPPVNTAGNEGALSISPDGMYLFFTACDREDSYGTCDIYSSRKLGNRWSVPYNVGPVINSSSWDSQPCLSSDGRTLYFVSTRPGGFGKSDIWESVLQPDGKWSVPENLGDVINTPEDEMAPFLHPDGQTLYFSSKGHVGMGGADLFMSTRNENNEWSRPINLGYPINTCADEINIIVDASGEVAYMSTDKLGGKGGKDIYSFVLDSLIRPSPVTYLKGVIFNSANNRRIEAKFEIIDLKTGQVVIQSLSDPVNGEFLVCVPTDKDYALNVSSPNYLFYSEHITTRDRRTILNPYLVNIALKPIMPGESTILKNIFFDTDQYVLKPESVAELNKLLDLLRNNKNLHIEIGGHTDNVGTTSYNEKLSMLRAKAVYDYLIQNGISPDRLEYKGYGYSRPIDSNLTEEGRANNRRTEFKVISN